MCLEDKSIINRKAISKEAAARETLLDIVYSGIVLVRVSVKRHLQLL